MLILLKPSLQIPQHQFCKTEGLHKVITLSSFRSSFADDYGLKIIEGELKGLSARAVIVLDDLDKVIHTQFLSELAHQVNHESIVISIKNAQDSTLIPPPFIEPAIELEYIELNIGNRRDYYGMNTPLSLQPKLERENANVLFIRDDLPSLHQTETQNVPVPNRPILKGNGARRKKIKDDSNSNP